jgi:hypothetical protein
MIYHNHSAKNIICYFFIAFHLFTLNCWLNHLLRWLYNKSIIFPDCITEMQKWSAFTFKL